MSVEYVSDLAEKRFIYVLINLKDHALLLSIGYGDFNK